jgi:hypothetical protein
VAEFALVDLIVDGGIYFDIGVRMGNIGFGLVIVIVADKNSTACWKKLPKSLQSWAAKVLLWAAQSRALHPAQDIGDGKGLPNR